MTSSAILLARPRFAIFIDESGDHAAPRANDPSSQFLGLVAVVFPLPDYGAFKASFDNHREVHFGHSQRSPVLYHRSEIVNKRGPFAVLQAPDRRSAFDASLLTLIAETRFSLLATVLSKGPANIARDAPDPYHECLEFLLAPFCDYLQARRAFASCMIESRGKRENNALDRTFASWRAAGGVEGIDRFRIVPKADAPPGLQLADLLARHATRHVLGHFGQDVRGRLSSFDEGLQAALENKWFKDRSTGAIRHHGMRFL